MSATEFAESDAIADGEHRLHRALGPFHLIMIGIGCIIGAGIFVIAGTAAAMHAGPAVLISFLFAALACLFAGLCYAEFAAMIPVSTISRRPTPRMSPNRMWSRCTSLWILT